MESFEVILCRVEVAAGASGAGWLRPPAQATGNDFSGFFTSAGDSVIENHNE
jgi:hypothetical protein